MLPSMRGVLSNHVNFAACRENYAEPWLEIITNKSDTIYSCYNCLITMVISHLNETGKGLKTNKYVKIALCNGMSDAWW